MLAISGVVSDQHGASVTWSTMVTVAKPLNTLAMFMAASPRATISFAFQSKPQLFGSSVTGQLPEITGFYIFR